MRKTPSSHRGLVWALAAMLAATAPSIPLLHAAARTSNAALLASQLPSGETLVSAPAKDVVAAVHAAVAKRPSAAAAIVRIAILARKSKTGKISSAEVADIVSAAVSAAPDQARAIAEMALSLDPGAATAIDLTLNNSRPGVGGVPTTGAAVPGSTTSETSDAGTLSASEFGAGFGPGFPGSPGFSGSSPSGGFALPNAMPTPLPTPVTTVMNG